MGLGQCSENYLHCIFGALSMQTWLNPWWGIMHYAAERVRLRWQIKAKRQWRANFKRTFSLSQMNNAELARTLSWRENALFGEREKKKSHKRGSFRTCLYKISWNCFRPVAAHTTSPTCTIVVTTPPNPTKVNTYRYEEILNSCSLFRHTSCTSTVADYHRKRQSAAKNADCRNGNQELVCRHR